MTSLPRRVPLAAFTLVELLVVVAIIGLLAALAFPALSEARRRGQVAVSIQNLRGLANANIAYAADNGAYVPADDRKNLIRWCGKRTSPSKPWDPAQGLLAPYMGRDGRVRVCPLFASEKKSSSTFEEGSGGYGYNASYIGGLPGGAYDKATGLRIPERPANVPRPARTVMFTTTALARNDGVQEYPYCEPPYWDFGDGPSGFRPTPSVHFRAGGKAIAAWCDGHASLEAMDFRDAGYNPYGGDADALKLGWFGPDEANGYWNPRAE